MRAFIIRRLLLVIPTLIIVTLIIFIVMRLIPGDIIDLMTQELAQFDIEETRASIEGALGLDVPMHIQYGRWVGFLPDAGGSFNGLLQGNLGDSLWRHTPVIDQITERLPITAELSILAMLIMVIISVPIGIYSAIRQDTGGDYVGRGFATLAIALPSFWVGLMIILLGSLWFGVSPLLSPTSFVEDPMKNLGQFILPALVLGLPGMGVTMRMTRAMMLEVLRQDYIRTAWAKGLKEGVVITRHALKNALIPVITTIGIILRGLVGATVIIETVFSLPGIGRLLVEATFLRDYTIVSGVIFVFAAFMIVVNIIIDLTYSFLDPRIRNV